MTDKVGAGGVVCLLVLRVGVADEEEELEEVEDVEEAEEVVEVVGEVKAPSAVIEANAPVTWPGIRLQCCTKPNERHA